MLRSLKLTLYCSDPNCEGWTGIQAVERAATMTEPAEVSPDYCPVCGHDTLTDARPAWEDAMAALIDELQATGAVPVNVHVDEFALYQAVHRELMRQEWERIEYERHRAATIRHQQATRSEGMSR